MVLDGAHQVWQATHQGNRVLILSVTAREVSDRARAARLRARAPAEEHRNQWADAARACDGDLGLPIGASQLREGTCRLHLCQHVGAVE